MARTNASGVYPNPSASRSWTDPDGRVWHRRGERGEALETKRVRALLRRRELPLAIWSAGELQWFDSTEEKQAATNHLFGEAQHANAIFPVEWKSEDGTHLLMLEHHC